MFSNSFVYKSRKNTCVKVLRPPLSLSMSYAVKKRCSYFECGAESVDHPDLTFFKLPNDATKFAEWATCGKLAIPDQQGLQTPKYFFCERHFSTNYISTQSRRKCLLGTAVPFRWDAATTPTGLEGEKQLVLNGTQKRRGEEVASPDEDEIAVFISKDETLDIEKPTLPPPLKKQKLKVNTLQVVPKARLKSPTGEEGDYIDAVLTHVHGASPPPLTPSPETGKTLPVVKKKASPKQTIQQEVSSKIGKPDKTETEFILPDPSVEPEKTKAAPSIEETPQKTDKDGEEEDLVLEDFSKCKDVTEFIFTGEKYVQMPKRTFELFQDIYKERIKALESELKYYKGIVKSELFPK